MRLGSPYSIACVGHCICQDSRTRNSRRIVQGMNAIFISYKYSAPIVLSERRGDGIDCISPGWLWDLRVEQGIPEARNAVPVQLAHPLFGLIARLLHGLRRDLCSTLILDEGVGM